MSAPFSPMHTDVVVIGAGAAGLTATGILERAGINVVCLEARKRFGGRILTVHDPLCPIPVELGAEFIHGRPKEVWDIVRAGALPAFDCTEDAVHLDRGKPRQRDDAWLMVNNILEDMQKAAGSGPDQSFASFLAGTTHDVEAKQLATSYVQGFNAADAHRIGIVSLAKDTEAADAIDGDRSFRIASGYSSVTDFLVRSIGRNARLHTNSVAEAIEWQNGSASVLTHSSLTGEPRSFRAKRVIITVPLGVLQASPGQDGRIHFDPEPFQTLAAAQQLCFGQVVRVTLRFRERLWDDNPAVADAGFMLSRETVFPTWWTPLPFRAPVVIGWSAGPAATELIGQDEPAVVRKAIGQFATITGLNAVGLHNSVEAAYYHDWHGDPFSRGAYSYAPLGALGARAALAQPVANTLFFAGEATETEGHSATVHGAIRTGVRAAAQVLESLR